MEDHHCWSQRASLPAILILLHTKQACGLPYLFIVIFRCPTNSIHGLCSWKANCLTTLWKITTAGLNRPLSFPPRNTHPFSGKTNATLSYFYADLFGQFFNRMASNSRSACEGRLSLDNINSIPLLPIWYIVLYLKLSRVSIFCGWHKFGFRRDLQNWNELPLKHHSPVLLFGRGGWWAFCG